ncbi:hypothetical protein I6F30_32860 [Bradyrhizobium sp. NBAIM20]|uniref:Uncharacterized protein n=1 Tax=Bradyrhizobium yuanmingense TaxID=108015 RepID=A0ABV4GQA5_9BRAD|nr:MULTISPECIES: hypothetical protein [Bradyrhizobium]MCA1415879.1 hypothetical protein [Bradyrhizobium sp. NBAIM20]MCA1461295.1 hypothetical protein [Bradyrhizobium sp. NBAIM18]
MGMVMIKCPETGRAISTGIEMDRERFRCSAVFFSRTYCGMCAATHEWFAKEAWVCETGSPGAGSRSARERREAA